MSSVSSFRKNGLVLFGARMASIFSGMLFLLMVTGWLRPARFGLWEVVTDLVTFAAYPAGLLTFWASRDIARGRLVGRTAVVLNLCLSVVGLLIFALFSLPTFGKFGSDYGPLVLAAFLVPLTYWNQAAASVSIGYRPASIGYALLFSEAAKLAVAYPALYILHLEINGVLLAIITSYFVQSLVTTVMVREALVERTDVSIGRNWLSDSWIPVLYLIPSQVGIADTFVGFIAGGSTIVGYYQAAFSLGSLVAYAGLLASALYPLLLRGGSEKAPAITLDLILLLATPMAVGVAVLAPHLLALLSPLYVAPSSDVSIALVILAGWGMVNAVSLFTDNTLMGLETADLRENRSFRSYLHSSFLFLAGVNTGYLAVILAGVYLIVATSVSMALPLAETVELWAGLQLCLLVPAVALKLRRVASRAAIRVPKALPYYVACSALMAAVLFAFSTVAPSLNADRGAMGEWVAGALVLGGGTYFASLLLIDGEARKLARTLLRVV